MGIGKLAVGIPVVVWNILSTTRSSQSPRLARFRESVVPALFIGTAMVARGEIGLLIAQIARGSESLGAGLLGDEAFLVAIWAILLCTLFSPIGVGFIVNRWKSRIVNGMWR